MKPVGLKSFAKRWKRATEKERRAKMAPITRISYDAYKRWLGKN